MPPANTTDLLPVTAPIEKYVINAGVYWPSYRSKISYFGWRQANKAGLRSVIGPKQNHVLNAIFNK